MKIARSEIERFIVNEASPIYAERTQMAVQTQIEESFVHMLQLGNNSASHDVKTASAWFLETIAIEVFSRGAADDVILQCFEGWSQLDTFLNAVVRRTVSNLLLVGLVAGFIKQHVDSATEKCRLTQL